MKRDRSKPKYEVLKAAIEAVLADPKQVEILADASLSDEAGVWWDEHGLNMEEDGVWDARVRNVETHLRSLLVILKRIPVEQGQKVRGGRKLPGEPDLTELDRTILTMARAYRERTGKAAANGAVGKNITNLGGPFVKEVAGNVLEKGEKIEKAVGRVIARIDRMKKHPRLKTLWNQARDPNWTTKTFGKTD